MAVIPWLSFFEEFIKKMFDLYPGQSLFQFFGMPVFIGSEVFQMVHLQYFHHDTAESPTPAISCYLTVYS